jgi:hypothetical protein
MSALGQKQTLWDFSAMSALPRKGTSLSVMGMSALCQKQKFTHSSLCGLEVEMRLELSCRLNRLTCSAYDAA